MMTADWYPEQRVAFIEDIARYWNDRPPQAGLSTHNSVQHIEHALHAIGVRAPNLAMMLDLTTFMLGLAQRSDIANKPPMRIATEIYDHLCRRYAGKLGYYPVPYQDDPFYTASGCVTREVQRVLHEQMPTITDIQAIACADVIRRRLEIEPSRPLDHSRDAWRRKKHNKP